MDRLAAKAVGGVTTKYLVEDGIEGGTLNSNFNVALPFYRMTKSQPERAALSVEGQVWSYSALGRLAQQIAGWLSLQGSQTLSRVGILASRSLETYAGILATCWSGAAYVPISPKLPEERLADLFQRTRLDALIVDAGGLALLSPRLQQSMPGRVLAPVCDAAVRLAESGTAIQSYDSLPPYDPTDEPRFMDESVLAYIIFTSGTTGAPKGVMITTGNVRSFVDAIQARYQFGPEDRVAHPSEVSFDNSVFDLFNAWEAGAALYVVPANQLLGPLRFLQDNAITAWLCAPVQN